MSDNLAIWKALSKTDPAHTKQFKRAGGFSGTAIKPMWIVHKLTAQFGPIGHGWGVGKPEFQVVQGDNREVLVYCTVECWHGSPDNSFYGVGGDKIVTHIKANEQYKRPERWDNDDEAFKKAFTDAVGNAFKFVGVGADVHMGQFEDSKYVQAVAREYAEQAGKGQSQTGAVSPSPISKAQADQLRKVAGEVGADLQRFCQYLKIDSIPELPADQFADALAALEAKRPKVAA